MDHSQHQQSTGRKLWPWAVGATTGVILAPYLLPAVGIGSYKITGKFISMCQAGSTDGLAPLLSNAMKDIPGIGGFLGTTAGSVITSGVIGLGGALLGRYIEKHYDTKGGVPWGKIIRYASLATSLLIALPSILSSISIGLSFLAFAVGGYALATTVSGVAAATLGFAPTVSTASVSAGISGLLPHLLTCGMASLPLVGTLLGNKSHEPSPEPQKIPKLELPPTSWAARVQNPPAAALSHSL